LLVIRNEERQQAKAGREQKADWQGRRAFQSVRHKRKSPLEAGFFRRRGDY